MASGSNPYASSFLFNSQYLGDFENSCCWGFKEFADFTSALSQLRVPERFEAFLGVEYENTASMTS